MATNEEAEKAALRIMLRQVAPSLKGVLTLAATHFGHTMDNVYMSVRFKENSDINNPENVIFSVVSRLTNDVKTFSKGQEEWVDELFEFFPYMAGIFEEKAAEWNLNMFDVFLTCRCKHLSKIDTEPENAYSMAMHTKKSCPIQKRETLV